ncbi:hypothetical protein ACWFR1_20715 [Streptomyces sp. NPDC055103]
MLRSSSLPCRAIVENSRSARTGCSPYAGRSAKTAVTLAFVPALLVLPFRRERAAHAQAMVRQLSAWTRVLLLSSRER